MLLSCSIFRSRFFVLDFFWQLMCNDIVAMILFRKLPFVSNLSESSSFFAFLFIRLLFVLLLFLVGGRRFFLGFILRAFFGAFGIFSLSRLFLFLLWSQFWSTGIIIIIIIIIGIGIFIFWSTSAVTNVSPTKPFFGEAGVAGSSA
uniref:Uncharacterized protein n=1 Tax=Pseudo-nitzschia delicatissima TaxID=44447 RepID=A0A7S0UIN6_9STRA